MSTTGFGGPAVLAKHSRHTCKNAYLLKLALVQTRKQFPGLNNRRMRACMCVYSVWLAGRCATGNSGSAFHSRELQQLALGGPPGWPNTKDTHASTPFF